MRSTTVPDSGIAIIDFAPFLDGSNKQEVANAILASFKDIGFVYLLNHGIPQERVTQMFEMSKTFFAKPMEIKQLAPHPPSGTHQRGYSAPGREKVTQHVYDPDAIAAHRAQAPDAKESFSCGRENDTVMPNIWLPDGVLPDFKETCLDFFWLCHEIGLNILRALALGFGLDEEYFLKYHTAPDNELALLHYPSVSTVALANESVARIGPHSDFGSITLLLQDDIGGLEVEDPRVAGSFRPAPPVPGALVVNAGDFMMRWSNDTIRSTIHRVRAPPGTASAGHEGMTPERYSIPYFCCACDYNQDFDTTVDCIPGTWSDNENEGRPKKYQPISAKEYIMKRLAAIY
ncbi:thymine dioxygenase [Mycena leptocephala]|nr:thymine dioxygenase [Mycena leptocephala]